MKCLRSVPDPPPPPILGPSARRVAFCLCTFPFHSEATGLSLVLQTTPLCWPRLLCSSGVRGSLHRTNTPGFPFLISLQISDRLRRSWPPSFLSEFRALQFSLMLCAFVGALGGAAFLGTAIFIEGDRRRAQLHVQGQWGLPFVHPWLLAQLHNATCSSVCLSVPARVPGFSQPTTLPPVRLWVSLSTKLTSHGVHSSAAPSTFHCLLVPLPGFASFCQSSPGSDHHPPPAGLLRETGPTDDRIVVPQRGRSTRVPVSSVLI